MRGLWRVLLWWWHGYDPRYLWPEEEADDEKVD